MPWSSRYDEVLTPRQIEVLHAILEGNTDRQAGNKLGISVETVGRHMSDIFCKLGCSTRVGMAVTYLSGQACVICGKHGN